MKILIIGILCLFIFGCQSEKEKGAKYEKQKEYIAKRCANHNGLHIKIYSSTQGGIVFYLCNDHTIEW